MRGPVDLDGDHDVVPMRRVPPTRPVGAEPDRSRNTNFSMGMRHGLGRALTYATQQFAPYSFDHLVGAGEYRLRHGDPDGPGCCEVDNELEPGRPGHWQVRGFFSLEDAMPAWRPWSVAGGP